MASLERLLQRLREQQEADRAVRHLEPKIDDRDLKIDDGAQLR